MLSSVSIFFVSPRTLCAQKETDEQVLKEFDAMVFHWEENSQSLDTYNGLKKYCFDREYKQRIIVSLEKMHHYDSLLYGILRAKMKENGHELRITVREIEQFENKYKPMRFIEKLNDDCAGERYLERHKKELKREIGLESYDGQAEVIENDAATYIHHINRLLDLIDRHAHHLIEDE